MSLKVNIGYYSRYLELNVKYFETSLPRQINITESPYMKANAGLTYFLEYPSIGVFPFEVSLSKKYLKKYPDDLDNVLLHEMIHIKLQSVEHDDLFIGELQRLKNEFGVVVDIYGKYLE